MVRAPCCEKMGLKKGPWTPEEDHILITHIQRHDHGNWRALPKQAGLLRCGKSCRLRWVNYLRPDIKRGSFTKAEEDTITGLHKLLGNRWSAIAAKLPGRTDNEIKNVWHTHLKKRLTTTTTTTASAAAATATDTSVQAPKQSPEMHPTDYSAAVCADNEYNDYSPSISCSAVDDLPNDGLPFSNDMDESFLDDKFWLEAAVWMDDLDFWNLQVPCADPSHLEGSVDMWVKLAMEESAAQDLP